MLKRVITKVKGVQNTYLKYRKTDIDPNGFLLEAGQGKNINGNMFAIARELVQILRGKSSRFTGS